VFRNGEDGRDEERETRHFVQPEQQSLGIFNKLQILSRVSLEAGIAKQIVGKRLE